MTVGNNGDGYLMLLVPAAAAAAAATAVLLRSAARYVGRINAPPAVSAAPCKAATKQQSNQHNTLQSIPLTFAHS